MVDGNPHRYVEVAYEIYVCQDCGNAIWQPSSYATAIVYADEIERLGREEAYAGRIRDIAEILDRISNGDVSALDDYKPVRVNESAQAKRILRKKGLERTRLAI